MSIKLFADKYIEINLQKIVEVGANEYSVKKKEEDYHLILCYSGGMTILFNDKLFKLKERDVMLIPSKSLFEIKKGKHKGLVIKFGGIAIEEIVSCTSFINNAIIHDQDLKIGQYFYKIFAAFNETSYLSIKCLGLFYELLYELTKNFHSTLINVSTQEKNIEIAKEFINQNYALEISIGDVAKKVGVTTNYLANIFNLHAHQSPKEYLTYVRMERAKKMLLTGRYKVKEVGKFVGYKNQLHFSNEFKKYTGMSPLQYIKSYSD